MKLLFSVFLERYYDVCLKLKTHFSGFRNGLKYTKDDETRLGEVSKEDLWFWAINQNVLKISILTFLSFTPTFMSSTILAITDFDNSSREASRFLFFIVDL